MNKRQRKKRLKQAFPGIFKSTYSLWKPTQFKAYSLTMKDLQRGIDKFLELDKFQGF